MMGGERIMTKTAIRCELRNVKTELDWLLWCEQVHNPDWRFRSQPFSKRRARLVKTYWALKALHRQN
jgi:hypothetical protein